MQIMDLNQYLCYFHRSMEVTTGPSQPGIKMTTGPSQPVLKVTTGPSQPWIIVTNGGGDGMEVNTVGPHNH